MALYVRIVNNEVKDVWDTPPEEGVGNGGWKNAVEVRPTIVPNRQGYTAHTFDLTTDPVQIVYGVYEITVEERKAGMKGNLGAEFQQVVNEQTRKQLNTNPDEIYAFFGMSKKAFKMNVGMLFKAKKITIEDNGIRLVPEEPVV